MHSNLLHIPSYSQFCWGEPGSFEIKNSVVGNFDKFVVTACKWIRIKIFPRVQESYNGGDESESEGDEDEDEDEDEFGGGIVNVKDYAVNVIWMWGGVFCGFGAYSIQEVFFRAG